MGQFNTLVSREVEVDAHEFSRVDAYAACGCATVEDTPLFNVPGWKGVGEFPKMKKKNYMKIQLKLVEMSDKRSSGWYK